MTNPPNQHIVSFLGQFTTQDPNYALMISGDWGSGKTFLVHSFFKSRSDCLYVSVNGATKSSDILERLYSAAFPVFADKTMRALGSVARSVAGAFRIKSDLKMEDLVNLDQFKVLIFDDLERTLMKPEELMGFINNFVEHDSKHVVLIANEDELRKEPTYSTIREKVVGFSLDVRPDFFAALSNYGSYFSTDYSRFLTDHLLELIAVISNAKFRNIRVAKYILNEFVQTFDQISEAGIPAKRAGSIFFLFFTISYAYKTGALSRDEIRDRITDDFSLAFMKHNEKYTPSALDNLDELSPSINIYSNELDNEYLVSKICDGFHDSEKLARTLGDIGGQTDPQSNPEWRNLWYLIHQNDAVIEDSFSRMLSKFHKREYDDAGVILHVFGLLYRMREARLLNWKIERITRECKKYIADQFASRSLPLLDSDYTSDILHGSSHGLGFTSINEAGFREAREFYRLKSDQLQEIMLIEELNRLIDSKPFNVAQFRGIILQGDRSDNVYGKPFLHHISPVKFAAAVLREEAEQQFAVLSALGSRYKNSPYIEVRDAEAAWLRKLIRALNGAVRRGSKSAKFRISEIIRWNLAQPAASVD